MKVSEALQQVSDAYVPGLIAHYEKFQPDPWWQAHAELERVMQIKNPELSEAAAIKFRDRCLELIERYKREGTPTTGATRRDGFNMNPNSLRSWHSRRQKICVHCESDQYLTIQSVPNSIEVVLICESCLNKGAA
jgi:hypothetical protein